MAGIIITRLRDADTRRLTAIVDEQVAAGFRVALDTAIGGWRLLGFAPLLAHMPGCVHEEADGSFAFACGAFFYRGHTGPDALAHALAAWREHRFDIDDASGNFALLLASAGRFELLTDALPSQRIYTDSRKSVFSTLLIPAIQTQTTLSPDPQGLYEYAWLHANHGQRTPFREIHCLSPGESLAFSDDAISVQQRNSPDWLAPDMASRREIEIVEHYAASLRAVLEPAAKAFGDRIKTALSGGYDSRLIAAGLIDAGSHARYYVYGRADSADRRVAQAIADQLSLDFQAVEKPEQPLYDGAEYRTHIDRKALVFDGLYPEGLFDNGVDFDDRMQRLQDADILLIGSGGESLRNFFYLPNRRYRPSQLIDTFWSTFAPAACTEAFDETAFRHELAQQLAINMGVDTDTPMTRSQAELAYPLFRVRYWSTREIAVNQRFGWCLYPYLDARMISGTATIPLRWKNHGRLEGKIIRRLSPEIAALKSDYGFAFDQPIPAAYRAKMQTTYLRPTWLRRYSYRLQMAAKPAVHWPDAETLSLWMNPALPRMAEYFRFDEVKDAEAFNRIVTLEYLFERHHRFNNTLSQGR